MSSTPARSRLVAQLRQPRFGGGCLLTVRADARHNSETFGGRVENSDRGLRLVKQGVLVALMGSLLLLSGCLGGGSDSMGGGPGEYRIDAEWTTVQLEAKTDYYQDGQSVEWTLSSDMVAEQISSAGGNVVGVLMSLSYPGEDETPSGLCTGQEGNVPDTILGTVVKGEWTRAADDVNPGSHDVNLTWHNQTLLDLGTVNASSEQDLRDQLSFGARALGTYDLTVTVEAEAFDGALCTHQDDGEEVSTVVSLLVLDYNLVMLGENGEMGTQGVAIGDRSLPFPMFLLWFAGVLVLVGYLNINRTRFHLDVVLEDDLEPVEGPGDVPVSAKDGGTLVDSARARILTLCALYVAQGIPWGFITVTFVTFLADEGVSAGDIAMLLTLGTLPWSLKFLWGPVIDRYQRPQFGRRRPWILLAQSGMIIMLIGMLFVPDPAVNVQWMAWMFLVYNVFTALQDVSTDALAVDVLPAHEVERVNSYMFTAKSAGGIIGGAGLGTIISLTGIKGALLLQVPILIVIMLVPMFMTERPGEKRFPWDEGEAVEVVEEASNGDFATILANVKTAMSLRSAQLGVAVSVTKSLAFFLIPILPLLFIKELDWSVERFNATKGGLILVVTMLGYLAGGQLGKMFGGKTVIIWSAVATAAVSTVWGLSSAWWGNTYFLMGIWCLHTFVFHMVAINTYSLMMRVTWGEVGGTQYTGYMAMMNLSAIIGYQLTEPLSRFDYTTLFFIAAALETFIIFAVAFIDPTETDRLLANNVADQPS